MLRDDISTAEAAEILRCSQRTIQRMIERGTLTGRKLDPTVKSIYFVPRVEILALKKGRPAKKQERTRRT